jgi:NAD(P)-dependent dehydrogenase (short-subunit alcohol dehydrogenase family)
MDLGLAGKTVVITGGSGGIGRGLLMEFAREGCNVVNASRDMISARDRGRRQVPGPCKGTIVSIKTDITDRKSVDAMVAGDA